MPQRYVLVTHSLLLPFHIQKVRNTSLIEKLLVTPATLRSYNFSKHLFSQRLTQRDSPIFLCLRKLSKKTGKNEAVRFYPFLPKSEKLA